jgi:FKBP-type peptidyl-prolyl cis-trans isomerase
MNNSSSLTTNIMFSLVFIVCSCDKEPSDTQAVLEESNMKYKVDLLNTKNAPKNTLDKNLITNNTDNSYNIIIDDNPPTDNSYNIITDDNAPISELIINDKIVGTGETPNVGDVVQIHYIGTLDDGTEFSNSYKKDKPFSFEIGKGKVIQGWDNGISTMRIGGKRQLIIPPELGYGSRGVKNIVPQNATLKFEIELIDINKTSLNTTSTKQEYDITKKSGLKMKINKTGSGNSPQKGQELVVHYSGELLNGKVFESTYDSGKPFIFKLGSGDVIQAFEEALSEMKKGGIRTLYVPSHLGYGDQDLPNIPNSSTLIYKVELVDFF